jgi:hypothetical protein
MHSDVRYESQKEPTIHGAHAPAARDADWNPFTLRIFGRELLDASASRAIAWRTFIVAATSSIDGLAWGATGWDSAGYAGMLIMGPIAAGMVFIADAAYLTADSSVSTEGLGGISNGPAGKAKWRIKKAWLALVFRISLAIGTTIVSGPSLISLVMHTDVNNKLTEIATNARAKQRPLPIAEMNTLRRNIDTLTPVIADEISGRNGRLGVCGPVCKDMKQQQSELRDRYDKLEHDLKTRQAGFDAGSENWISDRVQSAGPAERENALNELKDTPGYKTKRLTVAGMIWLLLTVMVILKVLEPVELKLYYSRWMQSMWPAWKSKLGMSALFFFARLKAGYWRLPHLMMRMDELKPKLEEALARSKRLAEDRATAKSRVDDLRHEQEEDEAVVANVSHMLETLDMSTSTGLPVENWNKQRDTAKGRLEEARRALPSEEEKLRQLDLEIQLAKREEGRLEAELDELQELIDVTTRAIDQSVITDWPSELPPVVGTDNGSFQADR